MSGRDRTYALLVVLVAVATVSTGLLNGFAYDDVALISEDARLHSWGTLADRVGQPWWPSGLFRPVSIAVLGAQWLFGGGGPLLFRLVSAALYAAVCVGVWQLGRRVGAPAVAALAGALLFAVHPVHVEVTANIVGQAELLSAGFVIAAVAWYVRARHAQTPLSPSALVGVPVLVLVGANAKESGYMAPVLLGAAELLVVVDRRALAQRWPTIRPFALALTAVCLLSLLIRTRVLGALGGETAHPSLASLSFGERLIAMVAIVPEWARLLLWPARLQADYGPPALVPDAPMGWAHLAGVVLILVMLWGAWRSRIRAPVVSFGLAWVMIALVPVANVLTPTGLLLAERTMFLPSVGMAIAVAGAFTSLMESPGVTAPLRRVVMSGFGSLLILAAVRSAVHQPVWRSSLAVHAATVANAPTTYRARMLYARELLTAGDTIEAETQLRVATDLWTGDPRPFRDLGQLLRVTDRCAEGVRYLRRAVAIDSTDDVSRSRLIECLIVERQWDEAAHEIERGLGQGVSAYNHALTRIRAAQNADPHAATQPR